MTQHMIKLTRERGSYVKAFPNDTDFNNYLEKEHLDEKKDLAEHQQF